MEFVVRVWLYFTCLCFADLVFCDDYAEIGGRITFSPSIRGKPVEILWKHNGDKVLEYDNSEMKEFGSFKDRVVIDFETGQLTVKKLTSQDSGQYQSDIMINGKVQIQSSMHTLTVLDVLPDPRVTCEVNKTSNLQELWCSADYKTPLQYKWSGPNVIDHPGAELIIDEQQKNSDSVYSCTVKNEVSSKTTAFNLQDCVTAARLEVILPVLLVIILLIFLIILAIFIYRKKKSKGSEQKKKDPENALSEATHLRLQNEEKAKLLKGGGNEEELYNNDNSLRAVVAEENASSKPQETEMQKEKLQEGQDEEEEGQREKREKGIETGESVKDVNEKLGDKEMYNAENNGKIPGEKKEEGNEEEKDQQITGSSEATFPNQMGRMHNKGSDEKQDEDNGSDNTNEGKNPLKEYRHENSLNAGVADENAGSNPDETLNQKLQEGQDEEEEGQREKPENRNGKGETSVDELTKQLRDFSLHDTDNTDKISEERKEEGNEEQKDQQSTELSGVPQDLSTQEISTAQSSNSQKHKEENQKPEKRNGSGETSVQQQNEGVKTEVSARNEDQQTTEANTEERDQKETRESDTEGSSPQSDVTEEGVETRGTLNKMEDYPNANGRNELEMKKESLTSLKAEDGETRQEENHEENTDSACNSEKPPTHNSDAVSSQTDLADTEILKTDNNKENVETKAAHNDDDAESRQDEETPEVTEEEDDNNGQRDKSSEPKQADMKDDPPEAGINKHLKDDEVKNPELDQSKDDLSVPEDKKPETQSDNFQNQEHLSKQSSMDREGKLNHENSSEESETDSDL